MRIIFFEIAPAEEINRWSDNRKSHARKNKSHDPQPTTTPAGLVADLLIWLGAMPRLGIYKVLIAVEPLL